MRNTASTVTLTTALRLLHPGQASRHPALFILEVAAALLSVLALRDEIANGSAVSLETTFALGLWATLLTVAYALTIRMLAAPVESQNSGTESPFADAVALQD